VRCLTEMAPARLRSMHNCMHIHTAVMHTSGRRNFVPSPPPLPPPSSRRPEQEKPIAGAFALGVVSARFIAYTLRAAATHVTTALRKKRKKRKEKRKTPRKEEWEKTRGKKVKKICRKCRNRSFRRAVVLARCTHDH